MRIETLTMLTRWASPVTYPWALVPLRFGTHSLITTIYPSSNPVTVALFGVRSAVWERDCQSRSVACIGGQPRRVASTDHADALGRPFGRDHAGHLRRGSLVGPPHRAPSGLEGVVTLLELEDVHLTYPPRFKHHVETPSMDGDIEDDQVVPDDEYRRESEVASERPRAESVVALQGVSFTLAAGQSLGVLGKVGTQTDDPPCCR